MAARARGRKGGGEDAALRRQIRVAEIIDRLHDHVMGEAVLTPAQIGAAKLLLAKVLPDLQSAALNTNAGVDDARSLTDAELSRIAGGGRARAAGPPARPRRADRVH